MLTYLISVSVIDSVDQSGVSNKIGLSWPHCFIKPVGEVETKLEGKLGSTQTIGIEIVRISCELKEYIYRHPHWYKQE